MNEIFFRFFILKKKKSFDFLKIHLKLKKRSIENKIEIVFTRADRRKKLQQNSGRVPFIFAGDKNDKYEAKSLVRHLVVKQKNSEGNF